MKPVIPMAAALLAATLAQAAPRMPPSPVPVSGDLAALTRTVIPEDAQALDIRVDTSRRCLGKQGDCTAQVSAMMGPGDTPQAGDRVIYAYRQNGYRVTETWEYRVDKKTGSAGYVMVSQSMKLEERPKEQSK